MRNSIVGPEILQEAKRIFSKGRVNQDIVFLAIPGLVSWVFHQHCAEAHTKVVRLARFVSCRSKIRRGVEVFSSQIFRPIYFVNWIASWASIDCTQISLLQNKIKPLSVAPVFPD